MKSIGIVGSRDRTGSQDCNAIKVAFDKVYNKVDDYIVSGGCPVGADHFAEYIAKTYQVNIMIYYAQWTKHGKAAGFIRNSDIAEDADILIATPNKDRTGGTEDTITKFLKFKRLTEEEAIVAGKLFIL